MDWAFNVAWIRGATMALKLIDLFSGAGGMTLGFCAAELKGAFRPILGIDNDIAAVKTHSANFSGRSIAANIDDWLQNNAVPKADVVIGGPPCQGFSLLNKKREGDERRALWEPFLDVVKKSGARVFVMENVAELFRSTELKRIVKYAAKFGFAVDAAILNSADYGAPQARKRTIVIGWDIERVPSGISLPEKSFFPPEEASRLNKPKWRTVRDAISDLPLKPVGTEIGAKSPLNLHFGRSPTPLSLKRYRLVPEGGNRFDLQKRAPSITPDCWIRKTSGGTDLFGRLWWDRPSVTIRTEFFKPEKGRYLHPVADRPITHREAARLMGFPDSFIFHGTKIEIARQIGNAVPPALASAIAICVRDALFRANKVEVRSYASSLAAE